mmetsp:Transcript_64698/g.186063  ORF Transcript_64698/g.186063 Transcript_64698/m.186063 type:complete len:232 (+) Transcript_64698:574-1269(+)
MVYTALDQLVYLGRAVCLEGRSPDQQFENEHAQHPPVDRLVVARLADNLWGHVVRRPDDAHRTLVGLDDLREAHVCELAVPAGVEQQILGLQIAVYHMPLVKMRQRLRHATDVELGMGLRAVQPQSLVCGEELPAEARLEQEVDVFLAVVGRDEAHDEGAVHHLEDVLLVDDGVLHLQLCEVALGHGLQRIGVPGPSIGLERDDAEGADAELADPLEVLLPHPVLRSAVLP